MLKDKEVKNNVEVKELSKNIKVLSLEASEIFKIQNGVDIDIEYKTVLPYSLLKAKMDRLHFDFKDNKSKDIIGVNFNYGFDTKELKFIENKIKMQKEFIKLYEQLVKELKNYIKNNEHSEEEEKILNQIINDKEIESENEKLKWYYVKKKYKLNMNFFSIILSRYELTCFFI